MPGSGRARRLLEGLAYGYAPTTFNKRTFSGQLLPAPSDAAKPCALRPLYRASVQQTGTNGGFNASGCERSGKEENGSERTYPKGGPEAATSERLPSGVSRCKRLLPSDPAARARRL